MAQQFVASGGGLLHSPAWMQIMADVLGHPVTASTVDEASSRGNALLALEALGVIPRAGALPAGLGATYTPAPGLSGGLYCRPGPARGALYRLAG